ncbi:hypothetical protein [Microbacterium sp. NPDC087592]|uniref:hypothetical protein n=1 Tax=Microbacterium sp. NPDC087592 TaxID=3364193 RepID=UPI00380F3208
MKITLGIVAGISLSILIYAVKQPTLDLLFNHDEPADPTNWAPKMRTWIKGVLQP